MSGTFKFKGIYNEGVLRGSQSQIKRSSGASALTPDAAAQLGPKAVELQRKKAKQVDVPNFVKTVRKEEVELGEGYKKFPYKKVEDKIHKKEADNPTGGGTPHSIKMDKVFRHFKGGKEVLPTERREYSPKISKEKSKYRKEEVELDEKIDVGADAGTTISDFVHSKSATFKGDSKKQRIKRALGAYYAAQKEETENIYDYVIEALVDAEFAEDYETAENMFECMSDEFVAVILEDYIEEAKRSRTERRAANAGKKGYDAKGNSTSRVSKTHVIHDVDDNVADQRHPNAAKIDVMRNNNKTKSLTPGEFAHHKLGPGEKYGFNAFRDTDKFKKTTKKTKVAGMGDSGKRSAKKSVVTARGGSPFGSNKPSTPMDKPGSFVSDLKDRIGVKGLERKDTHFTGGMSKGSNKGLSGPEKKAKVVSKIVKPSDKKIITTDDHLGNTRAMAAAASAAAPQSKVKAYQSRPSTKKPKGKGKVGDIVPSRVGKENKPGDTNIGIRANTNPSKSTKETQQRRQRARRGMGEEVSSYLNIEEGNSKGEFMSHSYQATKEDFDIKDKLFISFSGTSKAKNELKEETEMTPYEQWKSFVKENKIEEIQESVEIETELNEETESMTSYQAWKSYLESI